MLPTILIVERDHWQFVHRPRQDGRSQQQYTQVNTVHDRTACCRLFLLNKFHNKVYKLHSQTENKETLQVTYTI